MGIDKMNGTPADPMPTPRQREAWEELQRALRSWRRTQLLALLAEEDALVLTHLQNRNRPDTKE